MQRTPDHYIDSALQTCSAVQVRRQVFVAGGSSLFEYKAWGILTYFVILLRCHIIFTARYYASAVLAMGLCPSVESVSVRLSVTSRSSAKTAKHRITQTTSHDSPGTLVF